MKINVTYRVEHKMKGHRGWWHSPCDDIFKSLTRATRRQVVVERDHSNTRILMLTVSETVVK